MQRYEKIRYEEQLFYVFLQKKIKIIVRENKGKNYCKVLELLVL